MVAWALVLGQTEIGSGVHATYEALFTCEALVTQIISQVAAARRPRSVGAPPRSTGGCRGGRRGGRARGRGRAPGRGGPRRRRGQCRAGEMITDIFASLNSEYSMFLGQNHQRQERI